MAALQIDNISIAFGSGAQRHTVLQDVQLQIADGEFVSLVGHSGCGKSTLLNMIAGLLRPDSGQVLCGGERVLRPGPQRAVVFQQHALLPWKTCYQNVMLGVERVFGATESPQQLDARVRTALERVHLEQAAQRLPHQISGGMKQRVGIARALAMEPRVLLMDEPFGALDALTRAAVQDDLMEICRTLKPTVVMVTHDIDEAILLSDRVVMLGVAQAGVAPGIADILTVDLPRPRDRVALALDTQHAQCRQHLLRFLQLRHAA